MRFTKNFSLDEFTLSQEAARRGIDNTPSPHDIANLDRLAKEVLQPLRDRINRPIVITSGYRSPELNFIIGGAPNSAHMEGRAADIHSPGTSSKVLARLAIDLQLPFDQVINEFGRWVHIGIARPGETPRREELTAVRTPSGRTRYSRGI